MAGILDGRWESHDSIGIAKRNGGVEYGTALPVREGIAEAMSVLLFLPFQPTQWVQLPKVFIYSSFSRITLHIVRYEGDDAPAERRWSVSIQSDSRERERPCTIHSSMQSTFRRVFPDTVLLSQEDRVDNEHAETVSPRR